MCHAANAAPSLKKGLFVCVFCTACAHTPNHVERMGNYREAIKIILSRAEYSDEAVAEAVSGEGKRGGRRGGGEIRVEGEGGRKARRREEEGNGGKHTVLVQCCCQEPQREH